MATKAGIFVEEKRAIENATVKGFLDLYNLEKADDFRITTHGDSPDFVCTNSVGRRLNIETTTAHDDRNDMQVLLGRATSRKRPRSARLRDFVLANLLTIIREKQLKRYGSNTALVIRQTSGVDWDWEMEIEAIRSGFPGQTSPYDVGVWIIDRTMTKIWRVL